MRYCIKFALFSGLIGLAMMAAIQIIGPRALWEFAFWPSRLVGMGFDETYWPSEIAIQFTIYSVLGFFIGLAVTLVRGSKWTSPPSNRRS